MYPKYVEITKRGIINRQEYVTVPKEMQEAKHVSANEISVLKSQREGVEKELKELKKSYSVNHIKALEDELKEFKGINRQLNKALKEANKKVQRVLDIFKASPEIAKAMVKAENELFIKPKTKSFDMER